MPYLRRLGLYLCVALTTTCAFYALSVGLHAVLRGVGCRLELTWLCSLACYFPTDVFAMTIPVLLFWCIVGVWSCWACYLADAVWQQLDQ